MNNLFFKPTIFLAFAAALTIAACDNGNQSEKVSAADPAAEEKTPDTFLEAAKETAHNIIVATKETAKEAANKAADKATDIAADIAAKAKVKAHQAMIATREALADAAATAANEANELITGSIGNRDADTAKPSEPAEPAARAEPAEKDGTPVTP